MKCNKCGHELILNDNWTKGNQSKKNYICKSCAYRKTKSWVEANKEKTKEYQKNYYAENSDELYAKSRDYKAEHAEEIKEYYKDYYLKNGHKYRESNRRSHLKRKFGITSEQFDYWFEKQNGRCDICKELSSKTLHVDHNHTTGQIRGLLCSACNTSFGMLKEDINIMLNMIEYARKHEIN